VKKIFIQRATMKPTFFYATLLLAAILCSACTSKTNSTSLAEARRAFKTQLAYSAGSASAPIPPASVFLKITYPSAVGPLAAYLTPDPKDAGRHPAIIWITGGDSNSIDNLWNPSPPSNDQTAAAYRNAGIVMMFPSLRGGNDNPGKHEGFYGEVDDVLAAFDFLSKQPYVDPDRIYLGGHSTGGTLALLTAEVRNPFRAVFAFGPAGAITSYGSNILPVDFSKYKDVEAQLRSPGYWLDSASGQVFVIEGANAPGNMDALNAMKKISKNAAVHFVALAGVNHFSVLAPTNERIASKILQDGRSKKVFEMADTDF
jgi:acetyl esterase/lipase